LEDPYKILGVDRTATQDEIRRAYRRLAKQHHPDLNPGSTKSEDSFKAVTAANDILSDPVKRGKFDRGEIDAAGHERAPHPSYRDFAESDAGRRYSRNHGAAESWDVDDLSELFGSAFGEARGHARRAPRRGPDEHYALTVAFLDALNGATQRLTLPDGRTLEAKIPPGVTEGQVLRLRGQGGPGRNDGPSGDALMEIHITPHPVFRREGQNIRLDLPVTLTEAVLGGMVDVPTPTGPVRMRVPPASDTGTELRLRGRGVPGGQGRPAGDLYVALRVVLGPPDDALKVFLESWKPEHPVNPRQGMEARP